MINLSQKINPLILVQTPHLNTYELQELIHEYLIDQAEPNHKEGNIEPLFDVFRSLDHSKDLYHYFRKHLKQKLTFDMKSGFFYAPELGDHYWLQAGNIIIDITIAKFNHYPQIDDEIWNLFGNKTYLISDTIDHPLHQLYHEYL